MELEELVPSYIVFGSILTIPSIRSELPEQRDSIRAISFASREMARISWKLKFNRFYGPGYLLQPSRTIPLAIFSLYIEKRRNNGMVHTK